MVDKSTPEPVAGERRFQLLVDAPRAASDTAAAQAPKVLDILVVEDNVDLLDMVCELIVMLGHRVQKTTTAEEAIDFLSGERFDALLTDINLPGMSGTELAKKAVQQMPDMKVIFATGTSGVTRAVLGLDAIVLTKPFDFFQLQAVLSQL